jgi:hypothetical protein
MTDAKRRRAVDPELVDLFADDPGALAIVDAIVATQPTRKTSGRVRILSLAAAVIAVGVAVGALTRQGSQAGVVENALAALPTDRVLHLVFEDGRPAASVIDLRTGRAKPALHVVSEWFDLRSGTRRVRDLVGGVPVSDVRLRPSDGAISAVGTDTPAALDRFPALYRRALTHATNAEVTRRRVAGTSVFWLGFGPSSSLRAVAIDKRTYRPILIVFRAGAGVREFTVRDISALPQTATVPTAQAVPRPLRSRVVASTTTNGLPTSERWVSVRLLGESAASLSFQSQTVLRFSNGGEGLELLYGSTAAGGRLPAHFVRVFEARRPDARFGWSPVLSKLAQPGSAVIEQDGAITNAYVRVSGTFIRIMTSEGRRVTIALTTRVALR